MHAFKQSKHAAPASCAALLALANPAVHSRHPSARSFILPRSLCATDHRTKLHFDLGKVLEGGIQESIQAVQALEQQELLQELAESMKG